MSASKVRPTPKRSIMRLIPIPPFRAALFFIQGLVLAIFLMGIAASAALLAPADEARMAGKWIVSASGTERIYEITTGRNVKIIGSGIKDRQGHLTLQENGSFLVKLDHEELLRLTYTPSSDELIVEFFKSKKDLDMGLNAHWKTTATRKSP